jgi:large subunit ribosomal protein L24
MRKKRPTFQHKPHLKKGDLVWILSGADRSSEGDEPRKVLQVLAEQGRVIVEGVNRRWKHQRRSQQNPKGGRVQKEFAIPLSKVLLYSEKEKKGVRVRRRIVDGKRVRVGIPCGTRF